VKPSVVGSLWLPLHGGCGPAHCHRGQRFTLRHTRRTVPITFSIMQASERRSSFGNPSRVQDQQILGPPRTLVSISSDAAVGRTRHLALRFGG
jgi:hypothetical protein